MQMDAVRCGTGFQPVTPHGQNGRATKCRFASPRSGVVFVVRNARRGPWRWRAALICVHPRPVVPLDLGLGAWGFGSAPLLLLSQHGGKTGG